MTFVERDSGRVKHLISGTSEQDISSRLLHCLVSSGQLVSGGRADAMLLLQARLLVLSPPMAARHCTSLYCHQMHTPASLSCCLSCGLFLGTLH